MWFEIKQQRGTRDVTPFPSNWVLENLPKLIATIVILAVVIVTISFGMRTVEAGHRGVLTTFGKVEDTVLGEGLHFIIPYMQNLIQMNVQTLKYVADASASSMDLQIVSTRVAVNYHVDPGQANRVYQTLRMEYADRVIAPAIQESVKASSATFTAEQLITRRPEVKAMIKDDLAERLLGYGIIVEVVSIQDFDFSQEFNAAIEAKVKAEQQALEAERILQRKKVEAEQMIAEAGGRAESVRLEARARADATIMEAEARAEALRLQRQEVTALLNQYKAIEKWDGVLPRFIGGGAIPFIDITELVEEIP